MSRQVVFVLTSDGQDIYSIMVRSAVASIRISDPGVRVVVLCDASTHAAASAAGAVWLNEVDEVVSCAAPPGSAVYRSRYVKTRMRELVRGAFLFLDLDVLVRGSLEGAFPVGVDIAAAVNHGHPTLEGQLFGRNEEVLRTMGWRRSDAHYLNSGVIFFNDTPAAHRFGREWHQRWLEQWDRLGAHHDQPAFNAVLHDIDLVFTLLPLRYNAQVRTAPGLATGAAIWHYYLSEEVDRSTAYGCELQRLMGGVAFDRRRIAKIIRAPHPWYRTQPLDDMVARRVLRQGTMEHWDELWLQGRRWEAARLYYQQRGRHELRQRLRAMAPAWLMNVLHRYRAGR